MNVDAAKVRKPCSELNPRAAVPWREEWPYLYYWVSIRMHGKCFGPSDFPVAVWWWDKHRRPHRRRFAAYWVPSLCGVNPTPTGFAVTPRRLVVMPSRDHACSANVFFATPFASLPALRETLVPKTFRAKTVE